MQLLGSCSQRTVCSGWRSSRSQSGLPRVCRIHQLTRPRRTIFTPAAQSTDIQQHQLTVAPAESSSQIVPQNGTDHSSNLPTVPAPNAGPTKVSVRFEVPEYLTHWGQILKVVGSLEELGNWKVEKAPAMEWHEGHSWTLDVQLPVGAVNFKVVMQEPHGGVRWEQGTDRSVIIPETTSVTGAPVGEVDVTCNFNDVHNSRVEVRPDRNYLKQQLKAVEARVMAIQEKKRKLDQRMSSLTDGLKKYDQTVSLIESGVQDAVTERQRSKEAAAVAQQQQLESQLSAAADNAAAKQQQDNNGNSRRGGIMVPIINPEELPSFDDLSYTAAGDSSSDVDTAEEIAAADAVGDADSNSSSVSSSVTSLDEETSAVQSRQQEGLAGGMSAIKASHVSETVLSATVDQLLAAAEDALARSSCDSSSSSSSGDGAAGQGAISSAKMQDNGVNSSQLAEEYVEELLAAASALEQQADQRAGLLLEAARQSGDDAVAADIEELTTVPMPELPSPEQLLEAAAAEAAAAVEAMAAKIDDSSRSDATVAEHDVGAPEELTVEDNGHLQDTAAVMVSPPSADEDSRSAAVAADSNPIAVPEQAAAMVTTPQPQPGTATASTTADKDGTITFSAESLNAQVNTQELLAAVMKRIGIPLAAMSQVTISAKFTPAAALQQQEQPQAGQQEQAQAGFDEQQLGPIVEAQQQQAEQQVEEPQPAEEVSVPDRPKSPVEAIAAAIGAAAAAVAGKRRKDSSGGGGGPGGSAQESTRSNGRYSKSASAERGTASNREPSSARTAATVTSEGHSGLWFRPHARHRAEEAEKKLAAKEAARQAASEKVAAALAQVEEMRQSVITTNSVLADQLHGSGADGPAPPAGAGSSNTNSSSGSFSRYKVSYKDGQRTAAAAATAPASVNGVGSKAPKGGVAAIGTSSTNSKSGPRSMPTVAAAAVLPHRPTVQRGASAAVEGEVKEELLALAAIAASVQSTVDVEHGHQCKRSAEH